MTEDVILDVTADFIRSSEANLKLALQVERAMPCVREHFVRATLKAVEECFPRSEWSIGRSEPQDVMANRAKLWLTSETWTTQHQEEAAIWLGSDQPSWKRVWIGLYFTGGSSRKVQPVEQTMAPLTESGYTVEAKAVPGVYKYLDGELRDWSSERFLTRSLKDGPGEIASEISAELKDLDKFVRSLPQ